MKISFLVLSPTHAYSGGRGIILWMLVLFLLYVMSACTKDQDAIKNPAYRVALQALLSEEHVLSVRNVRENPSLHLVDTRSAEEYAVSHLPGAQFLGFDSIPETVTRNWQVEDTLVLYCSIGYRSERVAQQLRERGFKNVFNLYGGIFEWVNQNNILENEKGEPTRQVHPYNFWWGLFLTKGEKTTIPL